MTDLLSSKHINGPARRVGPFRWPDALTLAGLAVALLVLSPLAGLAWLALQPAGEVWPHLVAYVLPTAAADTAMLLGGVTIVALLLGVGSAFIVSTYRFPGRDTLVWLLALPLAVPTYIAAYVYVEVFEPLGVIHRALGGVMSLSSALTLLPQPRSTLGAIVIMGIVLYPYVYLSMRAALLGSGADALEAARLLGAGPASTFFRVTLPMARPALAVGSALVMLETMNDIGASEYLGVRTLTVAIFTTWLNRGSLPAAAQLSCLMLVAVIAMVALERYGRRGRSYSPAADSTRQAVLTNLNGWRAVLAFALCTIPFAAGFIVPLTFLMRESFIRGLAGASMRSLIDAAVNSVQLAAAATMLTLALGFIAVMAGRWRASPTTRASIGMSQTGYVLPGLVLALGLLSPLIALDSVIGFVAGTVGAGPVGLLLTGSGAAVVIAYTIRFLTIASGMIEAGFERVPTDFDDSARISGAGAWTTSTRIYLPMLQPALAGAAILVFVDCLKELPATLLLRPLNVETLSTSIYQYASRGSFEEGASAALLIVLASIVPVIWLSRSADLPREGS